MAGCAKPTQATTHRPNPIDVLRIRTQVRAYLFSIGEFADLPAAIDPLWEFAQDSGLVDQIGADAIQAIPVGPSS